MCYIASTKTKTDPFLLDRAQGKPQAQCRAQYRIVFLVAPCQLSHSGLFVRVAFFRTLPSCLEHRFVWAGCRSSRFLRRRGRVCREAAKVFGLMRSRGAEMGDSDMGKRKTGDTAQQVAGTKKARTSDADADADFCTDAVMLGGPRSDMDDVAGAADGDDVSTLDTSLSLSLPSGDRPASRERQRRDSPRGGLMTQGGQLVVANPAGPVPQPQGDDLAGMNQAIAVIYSPAPLAAAPFQIIPAPFDELDRSLSPGFQERAAASAVTAAVAAADNPAEAAAAIAAAGWHVSVAPSRNHPVPPHQQCSSCGVRTGIMVDRPTPHRCLCVECLLENAVCPVCGSGHQAWGA